MKRQEDKPIRKNKPNFVLVIFVIASLVVTILLGISGFLKEKVATPLLLSALGLAAAALLFVLLRRIIIGPRRQAGWGVAEASFWIKRPKWHGILGYAAGSLVLLGLFTVCAAAAWHHFFAREDTVTLTEGGRGLSPLDDDSLELVFFQELIYPDSKGKAINDYQTILVTSVEGQFEWDTVEIRVNNPLRNGKKRYYYLSHGVNPDSFYLHFDVKYPGGYTIPYEFPPVTTKIMEPDVLLPFVFSFDYFRIDKSHLEDIPEVKLNVLLPGKLLASEVMRAPDSIIVEGHTIYFPYVRMRQTVTLLCVQDESWKLAAVGCAALLVGLVAGFAVRIRKRFGEKE
ncbi:hypothetical protein JXM67_13350 [candidate division WOR-3 bacterium]|nr:hypothetical protein [candidate division WOR-3 bacterium]